MAKARVGARLCSVSTYSPEAAADVALPRTDDRAALAAPGRDLDRVARGDSPGAGSAQRGGRDEPDDESRGCRAHPPILPPGRADLPAIRALAQRFEHRRAQIFP